MSQTIYLDCFDDLVARRLVSDGQDVPGQWRLERGCYGARHGQLLFGSPGNQAGTIVLEPRLTGTYAIHVGAYSPAGRQLGIYVRLCGQPHFTYLQLQRHEPSYEAIYFTTARLDGQAIEVACFNRQAALDYISFVPTATVDRPKPDKALLGILDFSDDAGVSRPKGFEAGSAIRRHADVGYNLVAWKAYAVRCEYHTKVGELRSYTDAAETAVRSDDLAMCNADIADLLRQYDTMRQAVDEARKVNLPIFGWARISNEFSRMNHQFSATTRFHKMNPDKFQQTRDGHRTCKLSFAYSEVRRHKIDILCEIAAYGMDGIFIDVLRHPPMVSYDQPIVDAYLKLTGNDPRQLVGDGDEDWLRFRADRTFTQFLRETRAALDKQAGRRLPLYVRTVDQAWYNLLIGCDVEAWMRERLVDGIVFGPWCASATNYPDNIDLRSYVKQAAAAGSQTKILGQVWRYGSARHAQALAADLYEQGVDGVAFYESNATVAHPTLRRTLWRYSRPALLAADDQP